MQSNRFHLAIITLALALLTFTACDTFGDDDSEPPVVTPQPTQPTGVEPTPETAETDDDDVAARLESLSIDLEHVAGGLENPTSIAHPGDGSGRLFVLEREGRIRVLQDGDFLDEPFLDIAEQVHWVMVEQGLLGLAFHPEYGDNGKFYVNYIDRDGHTSISEFRVSDDDPNLADSESERRLMHIEQPHSSHNGGQISFGPDGFLYIGLGDGEDPGDPHEHAQNPGTLLGAILRIDVDVDEPYAIPSTNPFIDDDDARNEVWAIGLRNPWRFSWDARTNDLYIADVGQWAIEAINVEPAGSPGGVNYGWPIMEGDRCWEAEECDKVGLTLPVATYEIADRSDCAVIGGYVYRGQEFPHMDGIYFYGDWCSGIIRGLAEIEGEWIQRELRPSGFMHSALGLDEDGELYITAFDTGDIYRIVAE